jgi:hypothetical protein
MWNPSQSKMTITTKNGQNGGNNQQSHDFLRS